MRTENGDLFSVFLRKVRHRGLERVRKTRIDRKSMRFVFVMFALSYAVSILFEGRFGELASIICDLSCW